MPSQKQSILSKSKKKKKNQPLIQLNNVEILDWSEQQNNKKKTAKPIYKPTRTTKTNDPQIIKNEFHDFILEEIDDYVPLIVNETRVKPSNVIDINSSMIQSGSTPFQMKKTEKTTDITIKFETPFESSNYVVMATANHLDSYAVLKSQTPNQATFTIVRQEGEEDLNSSVSWIAIGCKRE